MVHLRFSFRTAGLVGLPHAYFGASIGDYAVRLYRAATPVRTGAMRDGWAWKSARSGRVVTVLVYNREPHARFVFERQSRRFRGIPARLRAYARKIAREVG